MALSYVALGIWTFIVLFPLYWLVVTSLKLPIQVHEGPFYLPFVDFQPSLDAWYYIVAGDLSKDTWRTYLNTVIVAPISAVITLILGTASAYALTRFNYQPRLGAIFTFIGCAALAIVAIAFGVPWLVAIISALVIFFLLLSTIGRRFKRSMGNDDIAFWMISQRILPPIVIIIPIYMMYQAVGLLDTHLALIIIYAVANLPIVVWLMHDFFASLPVELEESAQLDGSTRFGIFWEIVLPLTRPGLAATTLLTLILNWNEYLFAVFLSTAKAQTMPIMVAAKNAGEKGILWWEMCAVIVIMIIPVILMAVVLQRFIAKGVLLGAVKG